MKKLIITSIIAILSVLVCVACSFYISSVADKSEKYLNQIETFVSNNQLENAKKELGNLENHWEESQYFLSMILHHENLEEIESSIVLMKSSLNHSNNDYSKFWNELDLEKLKIENLRKCESLSLENLF